MTSDIDSDLNCAVIVQSKQLYKLKKECIELLNEKEKLSLKCDAVTQYNLELLADDREKKNEYEKITKKLHNEIKQLKKIQCKNNKQIKWLEIENSKLQTKIEKFVNVVVTIRNQIVHLKKQNWEKDKLIKTLQTNNE